MGYKVIISPLGKPQFINDENSGGNLFSERIQTAIESLASNDSITITHPADIDNKRNITVLKHREETDESINFSYADIDNYARQDNSKIELTPDGRVKLIAQYRRPGMVLNYLFLDDECKDFSLQGHNGTEYNCVYGDGIVERHLYIQAPSASYVEVPNNIPDDFNHLIADTMTWEFWVKSAGDGEIINLWNETDNRRSWRISIRDGKLTLDVSADGSTVAYTVQSDTNIAQNGNWHYCAIILNGDSAVEMFIDGVAETSKSVPVTPTFYYNSIDPILIGKVEGLIPNFFGSGYIAELAIYKNEWLFYDIPTHFGENMAGQHLSMYDTTTSYYICTGSNGIDIRDWDGILKMQFYVGSATGSVLCMASVDGKNTWKVWNGIAWNTINFGDIHTLGNGMSTWENLTREDWDELLASSTGTLDLAFSLRASELDASPDIDTLYITYLASGKELLQDNNILVKFLSPTTTQITNLGYSTMEDVLVNILI
jgi:hypothetical protein